MNAPEDIITSLQNSRVKDLVKLRDRSGRESLQLMLIEETRVIERALSAGHPLRTIYTCSEKMTTEAKALSNRLQRQPELEVIDLAPHVMAKVAYRNNPEGLLATAPLLQYDIGRIDLPADPLLLVIESVEKPGNLGAVLRSANGAGVDLVLICGQSVDLCNPNVLRASTGAVFMTPTAAMAEADLLDFLKSKSIRMIAATPDTQTPHTDTDLTGPVAIIVGAEDTGLTVTWLEAADQKVRIPMHGQADSLNLSVSAAILVYEAERQRRAGR